VAAAVVRRRDQCTRTNGGVPSVGSTKITEIWLHARRDRLVDERRTSSGLRGLDNLDPGISAPWVLRMVFGWPAGSHNTTSGSAKLAGFCCTRWSLWRTKAGSSARRFS
jgi:hypothetical protein